MPDTLAPMAREILDLWFGETQEETRARAPMWWTKDPELDERLRERFAGHLHVAAAGGLSDWESSPAGAVALVVLLDQFSRNIHRGNPKSFAQDAAALAVTRRALARGFDRMLDPPRRVFLYMPLMHSEQAADHADSLRLFEALASVGSGSGWEETLAANFDFAKRHAAIIHRFGRYPHRNEVLGRTSSAAEAAHVAEHGGF